MTQPLLLYAAVAVLSLGTGLFCHVLENQDPETAEGPKPEAVSAAPGTDRSESMEGA